MELESLSRQELMAIMHEYVQPFNHNATEAQLIYRIRELDEARGNPLRPAPEAAPEPAPEPEPPVEDERRPFFGG